MNRLLAAFSPRTTQSDTEDGCCPNCQCNARKLRAETRDRAMRYGVGQR